MKKSPRILRVVGVVGYLVAAQTGFSASTFVASVYPGQTDFSLGGYHQPFAATMIYRWEVYTPGDYFSVDTLGQSDWYITPSLGLQPDLVWWPDVGMKVRDLIISLENETGNLTFARTETINASWPGGDGILRYTPITGVGTFTAINFTLNFDNVAPSLIGEMVTSDVGNSSYYASSFSINGPDGLGGYASATVVPEPSSGVLLVLGIGGVIALRRCRRSGV